MISPQQPQSQPTPAAAAPTPGDSGAGQRVWGGNSEASIDQVNTWMRSTPWYQDLLKQWGFAPGQPVRLNDAQRQQIVRNAQAQGVVVDEGNIEVDPSGNFNPKGHKLRNTLIVAGIAGATIATMGAAGAFAGAAGAAGAGGSGAAGAGAAAGGGGLLASSATAPLIGGTVAGGTGLGAGGSAALIGGGAAAGAAGGGAGAAGAGGSLLGKVAGVAQNAAPILGGMAKSNQAANQQQTDNDFRAAQLRLAQEQQQFSEGQQQLHNPAIMQGDIARANAMAAGPVQAHWGGPGSGLRGETVQFTGGANAPQSPETKAAMQQLIQQKIQQLLAPPPAAGANPAFAPVTPKPESGTDKLIGGLATGAGLLGGFSRFLNRK